MKQPNTYTGKPGFEQRLGTTLSSPLIRAIQSAAETLHTDAYLIGGFVRDLLLDRNAKDLDVVTTGNSIQLARVTAELLKSAPPVEYSKYGVARIGHEGFEVEFVTARKESYHPDSRKPDVSPGSLYDDQIRRDFTINALSISLNTADFGQLVDPFDGLSDLQQGIIRTPTNPDLTFSDDPLRMMRAIRFAAQLGFFIEPETFSALNRNKDRLQIISAERISTEVNKVIMSARPSHGFTLFFKTGLLRLFFPELTAMHGVDYAEGKGHKDNFYHTLQVLDHVAEVSENLWLRWVAILHDIAKPLTKRYEPGIGWTFHGHEERGARMVKKIFTRMKLPLDQQMRYVEKLVRLHQRPIALVNEEVSDSAIRRLIVEAGDDLDDLLMFCRADITSKNENKVTRFLQRYDELEVRIREVTERDNLRNWQPPITGEEIMATFQLTPGPKVGQIKNEIREAILEGHISNEREAALEFMHSIAPKYL